jgi:hypothetical protein
MKHLLNNFYLLPKGFRQRKLAYTFHTSKVRNFEDYTESTYIRLFWRLYLHVRVTSYFDPNRPPIGLFVKFKVL